MRELFNIAFEKTIGHEGGYVNDIDDPGGETKFGISKRSYPTLDIKNLTLDQAKNIYYRDFWLMGSMHLLESFPEIAIELFDTSVNVGLTKGATLFQEALNLTNRNQKDYQNIKIDGQVGRKTIDAFHSNKNKKRLYNIMNILQGEWYVKLMRSNEIKEKYIGWFDRIEIIKL